METRLRGWGAGVVIGPGLPTAIIGRGADPASSSELAAALGRLDPGPVVEAALALVRAGADVVLVGARARGVDEARTLPLVVRAVAEAVPVPLCIESDSPEALAAALEVCPGKPLVAGITASERSVKELLPLAQRRGAAVLGLAAEEAGVPRDLERRIDLARHVLRMAITVGIPREDVILDPGANPAAEDPGSGRTTLRALAHLARLEQVNLALRAGTIAAGLPGGEGVENLFLAMALAAGATCAVVDPVAARRTVRAADLLLGRGPRSRPLPAQAANSHRNPGNQPHPAPDGDVLVGGLQ